MADELIELGAKSLAGTPLGQQEMLPLPGGVREPWHPTFRVGTWVTQNGVRITGQPVSMFTAFAVPVLLDEVLTDDTGFASFRQPTVPAVFSTRIGPEMKTAPVDPMKPASLDFVAAEVEPPGIGASLAAAGVLGLVLWALL